MKPLTNKRSVSKRYPSFYPKNSIGIRDYLDPTHKRNVIDEWFQNDPQLPLDLQLPDAGRDLEQGDRDVGVPKVLEVHVHGDLVLGAGVVDLDPGDLGRNPAELDLAEAKAAEVVFLQALPGQRLDLKSEV